MERLVVADTDVVIDFFTGSEPYAELIAGLIKKDLLALTSITVFELYAGVLGSKTLEQIDDIISLAVFPSQENHPALSVLRALAVKNSNESRADLTPF